MEVDSSGADSRIKAEEEKENGKGLMVILVGAPGSGKSTFCQQVMRSSSCSWVRICQDTIGNGKAGSKTQCMMSAATALKEGKNIFIDRCNLDKEQRADFIKLGGPCVDMHAVVLDLPAKLCISRSVKRTGHEGNLQGGKAAAVVNRMLQNKELPKLSEGYSRITFCQNESDVQAAIDTYSALSPSDTLPSGCFGQKNPDSKIQLGIMKFLRKVDTLNNVGSDKIVSRDSVADQISLAKDPTLKEQREPKNNSVLSEEACTEVKDDEILENKSPGGILSLDKIPTLAFPSISTADFQFNLEKASDIIVEKVEEYLQKLGNARLVLVDLSHGSKILSLVRNKATKKNIDSNKFSTFVGDITKLYSVGGLCCNIIANAANWRLKPGGGGVNAAIFNAAGPALEAATKEQAATLATGKAVVVPLPSASPLFIKEGVTHIIHVLGPNMNPQRPNCLNNDYMKGCKILRDTYSSLFECFTSLLSTEEKLSFGYSKNFAHCLSESEDNLQISPISKFSSGDQKFKREYVCESEKNKKCKGFQDEFGTNTTNSTNGKDDLNNEGFSRSMTKGWGKWAQALHNIAMHPEKHKNDLIEISDDVVVLNDLYPKAQRHLLVLLRSKGLQCLADVGKEHIELLKTMHSVGMKWAEKFYTENDSLVFRLGYHSAPSMRQLHLHVISQDFDSKLMKNKKHWNSFNSPFFRDSTDVIEEVDKQGKAKLNDDNNFLSMELRCHRCRSAHPNIPRLKSHISHCRATFPADLLQKGRLVSASISAGVDK